MAPKKIFGGCHKRFFERKISLSAFYLMQDNQTRYQNASLSDLPMCINVAEGHLINRFANFSSNKELG